MVEYKLPRIDQLYSNTPIVDLIFIDTNGFVHIIELKCPKDSFGENLRGLGQCLTYQYIAGILNLNLASIYLITTNHCNLIPLIIRDNKLEVKYIYFDKTRHVVSDTEQ